MTPPLFVPGREATERIEHLDPEMTEVKLLLPSPWLNALEQCATARNQTVGELVRQLIWTGLRP